MSNENEADVSSCCCASCGIGIAEIDDIKLMPCDGCDLVQYCGDGCREDHKSEHEEACAKRAAELRDELLFKQPESTHLGDCPICCLPLPIDGSKSGLWSCCSKIICMGCWYANPMPSCPFCRKPLPDEEESCKQNMKRVEANDPAALCRHGANLCNKGDYIAAFEYFTKSAELGDAQAHYRLAEIYCYGHGVEKDIGKKIHHMEEAAISGHPGARYNLGVHEWNNNDNAERAVKHWIIAATLGDNDSITDLIDAFKEGFMAKEDLAAALRAHKAAVDATKSPEREAYRF